MQAGSSRGAENPLSEFISDDVFHVLADHRLLDERRVRDYQIRKRFREMREQNVPPADAIDRIREDHPNLQFDTIRKIAYALND